MISIIIPAYKCEKTIKPCVDAIISQNFEDFEIIIVLDGPNKRLEEIISQFGVSTFILDKNRGPAYARNYGAKQASGDILFFIDSDMVICFNALEIINRKFESPKISILQGMYDQDPANPNFITKFAAYKKWIDYSPETTNQIGTIGSEIFAIRTETFWAYNGFDESYIAPTVEDYEFGYRLAQNNTIFLTGELRGKHYFPTFRKMWKNYLNRAEEWGELFFTKKKKNFDRGATNSAAFLSSLCCGMLLIIGCCWLLSYFLPNYYKSIDLFFKISLIIVIFGFLILNIKYFSSFVKKFSFLYSLKAIIVLFLLDYAIFFGGLLSSRYLFVKKRHHIKREEQE